MECVPFVWFHSLLLVSVKFTVTGQFEAWVCGRSLAGIAGSNPAGIMDVLFLVSVVCCQVEVFEMGRSLFQRNPTECVYVTNCDQYNSNFYTYND